MFPNGVIDKGTIGEWSCNNVAIVGDFKPDSQGICGFNGILGGNGEIGANSCNNGTQLTCLNNGLSTEGKIGDNACNAPGACWNNQGVIESGCCNYDNACQNNTETISITSSLCD